MKLNQRGHGCLLIEIKGVRILTDLGAWTKYPEATLNSLTEIDAILISHEHSDHIHVEALNKILNINPNAQIYTNPGVGKILDEAGNKYNILNGKSSFTHKEVSITNCKYDHA